MSKNPWMKFYPTDWRSDPALRMCSLTARGLWMEMIAIMHEASPRGSLLVNGKDVAVDKLALLCGASVEQVQSALNELEDAGVFSRKKNGVIYSRRMERDENLSRKRIETGKMGGNPSLCKTKQNDDLVNQNPSIIPEARSQIPEEEKDTPSGVSKKPTRKIGCRLPEDWEPTEDLIEYGKKDGLPEDRVWREVTKFKNYWAASSRPNAVKKDWNKAFQNWVMDATDKYAQTNQKAASYRSREDQAMEDLYARVL